MKILEPGKVGEIWTIQYHCTAWGNSGEGCGALLEIKLDDLRFYEGAEYPWRVIDPAVSFKCPCCGKLTDLKREEWPANSHKLKPWTREWNNALPHH